MPGCKRGRRSVRRQRSQAPVAGDDRATGRGRTGGRRSGLGRRAVYRAHGGQDSRRLCRPRPDWPGMVPASGARERQGGGHVRSAAGPFSHWPGRGGSRLEPGRGARAAQEVRRGVGFVSIDHRQASVEQAVRRRAVGGRPAVESASSGRGSDRLVSAIFGRAGRFAANRRRPLRLRLGPARRGAAGRLRRAVSTFARRFSRRSLLERRHVSPGPKRAWPTSSRIARPA